MTDHTLFTDFLTVLGVPHTGSYSIMRFSQMPFRTLFGLKALLQEYGVKGEGIAVSDKSLLTQFGAPFIAETVGGLVIVTEISPDGIGYLTQGVPERMPADEFEKAWTGKAFLAYPDENSIEPEYKAHCRDEFIARTKRWLLWVAAALLFMYMFVSNGLYRQWSTVALAAIDLCGLGLTYMLLLKSLKIKSKAADSMCAVLQKEGCDHVLEQKASTFFGIFSWSEVGFAYFSVSLLCLLMFPQWIRYLAACNLCCLPFTFWSIWYQKCRAKAWCTLCVSVQASLWLLFFCYLGGGWLHGIFPLGIEFFILGITYLAVLLALNRVLPHFAPTAAVSSASSGS